MRTLRTRLLTALLAVLSASVASYGCGSDTASTSSTSTTGGGGAGGSNAPPVVGDVEVFTELPSNSEGLAFGKGPNGEPVLYVGSKDQIHRVHPDGSTDVLADLKSPVGMAVRADGDLIVCGVAEGMVDGYRGVLWRITPSGEKSVLVGPGAFTYKLTNFVAVAPDDSIAFTDSGTDKLYRADADGSNVALVSDAISYANGIAFSKDGKTLFVASWDSKKVMAVPRAADGSYGAPEVFAADVDSVDGIAVFSSGDLLLVESGEGLVRYGLDKTKTVLVPGATLGLPANGAFGAGDFGEGWVYVTNLLGPKLWRVYVGEAGVALPAR